ncbi:SIMPL domain-containing protein [Pseudoleptotrichia goodfellowii]|uniref:SIMPL domain-containing protein n=1 Tax=Pseudoleptotrichia goodfellowii TaxID=157692 RepID=A0A510J9Y7_9FUSO|nr:SIMPL domain-containing protein [Pseudoleptotrichia goodfellowii]BBM36130.1 hypothetical protein JCM16774_1062 [Pseudoleptotrichia goodfellowii]
MKKIFTALFLILAAFSFGENVVRKISVTGNSEREVLPDTAKISFKIQMKNQNLNTATKELKEKIEKFKSGLRAKKIELSNFETVSFYSNKTKDYNDYYDDYRYVEDEQAVYDVKGKTKTDKDKKPASYTIQMQVIVKNTTFDKISKLIEFSGNDAVKNIKKYEKDSASYYFVLNETDINLNNALSKTLSKFNSVKSKLQSSGISANDIVFSNYKVIENQNVQGKNEKDVFVVTEEFTISTKNLKNLNDIISLADDNSINVSGSIYFDISDKDRIASEMYNEAFNQAKSKAVSILKSSNMMLSSPLVVSEDIAFQQKMIDRIDQDWAIAAEAPETYRLKEMGYVNNAAIAKRSLPKVDYTPKPIKLSQNISVLYEIK